MEKERVKKLETGERATATSLGAAKMEGEGEDATIIINRLQEHKSLSESRP